MISIDLMSKRLDRQLLYHNLTYAIVDVLTINTSKGTNRVNFSIRNWLFQLHDYIMDENVIFVEDVEEPEFDDEFQSEWA